MRYFIDQLRSIDEKLKYFDGHILDAPYHPEQLGLDLKNSEAKIAHALEVANHHQALPGDQLKDAVRVVLSSYDFSEQIEFEEDPGEVAKAVSLLQEKQDSVDTVGHYKTKFFDPADSVHWEEMTQVGLRYGEMMSLYGKALKSNTAEATTLLRNAGQMLGQIKLLKPHERHDSYAKRSYDVKSADGLHMRPALEMVNILEKYPGDVIVSNKGTEVNGKSMMEVSMLAATKGQTVDVMLERVPEALPELFFRWIEPLFQASPLL